MNEACDEWCRRLGEHFEEHKIPPRQLYRGLAFHTINRMGTHLLDDHIKIISIGQGLVGLTEPITPYDLSIMPDHMHSLTKVVTEEPFSPTYWWQLINSKVRDTNSPIADLAANPEVELLLVACSNRFLSLIVEDIVAASADPKAIDKIRILSASRTGVPRRLLPFVIPYDRRLSINTIGNKYDVNQRAGLHFLKLLESHPGSEGVDIFAHKEMVSQALDELGPEEAGQRKKRGLSEEESARLREVATEMMKEGLTEREAYIRVQRKMAGVTVSALKFTAVWRSLTNGKPKTKIETKASEAASSAALAAFQGLSLRKATNSIEGSREAVDALLLFKTAVEQEAPDSQFTSQDICLWAQSYYEAVGEDLPEALSTPKKVGVLMRQVASEVGIAQVKGVGAYGASKFVLSGG
jgi:hypothetical protein